MLQSAPLSKGFFKEKFYRQILIALLGLALLASCMLGGALLFCLTGFFVCLGVSSLLSYFYPIDKAITIATTFFTVFFIVSMIALLAFLLFNDNPGLLFFLQAVIPGALLAGFGLSVLAANIVTLSAVGAAIVNIIATTLCFFYGIKKTKDLFFTPDATPSSTVTPAEQLTLLRAAVNNRIVAMDGINNLFPHTEGSPERSPPPEAFILMNNEENEENTATESSPEESPAP